MQGLLSDAEGENNSIDVVGALLLLSQGGEEMGRKREFSCKTCSRRFSSFQALGGHRASHKKPRPSEGVSQDVVPGSKAKVHECPVCGLGFAVGQALGGHMRKHRSANEGLGAKKPGVGEKVLALDLNLPASGDIERGELGLELRLGLEFVG